MFVYMLTHSGARTNICADYRVVDTRGLIEYVNTHELKWRDSIRFAEVNSENGAALLKHMSLETFERAFTESDFSPEQIDNIFRAEISEKYGIRKLRKETKRIPKSELEIGRMYVAETGSFYWYFGKIKGEITFAEIPATKYSKVVPEHKIEIGGVLDINSYNGIPLPDLVSVLCDHYHNGGMRVHKLKTISSTRKFIEPTQFKVEVQKNFTFIDSCNNQISLEFLDFH